MPETTLPLRDAALFLDFDGTLVDIAPRPQDVAVDPALGGTLSRLREHAGGALAVVTGRPVAVIDAHFAPERFDVAGLHGAELRVAGVAIATSEPDAGFLSAVSRLRIVAEQNRGLILEDKGRSVALHWRLAPHLAALTHDVMTVEAERLAPAYRLQTGKSVLELLPAGATKGRVIATLLTHEPYRARRPVFIGDDVTDEDGFAVVNAAGGLSVRVGAGPSEARCRLRDPHTLRQILSRWADSGTLRLEECAA